MDKNWKNILILMILSLFLVFAIIIDFTPGTIEKCKELGYEGGKQIQTNGEFFISCYVNGEYDNQTGEYNKKWTLEK